jgi:hypothetical protein
MPSLESKLKGKLENTPVQTIGCGGIRNDRYQN